MPATEKLESRYIVNTYNRRPGINLAVDRGKGSFIWDEKNRRYLDLVGGLAVNVIGHCHPAVVEAVQDQVARLIHTSNLYYTVPQVRLAKLLVENSAGDRVFFGNSGAEANEAAIKITRKYNRARGQNRYKIITAYRSFHGRTLATVTATGQTRYQQGFEPLMEGFAYAQFNDLDSFAALVDQETAAIMIEPVQGEGGVYVAGEDFMHGLRELCDREGLLLIFDEVQCGMGRTGWLWAYERFGVEPDLLTTAKGLGGGLPIGVMLAREEIAAAFKPGDHASTFGGNPVACHAACAVLQVLLETGFLEEVRAKGLLWEKEINRFVRLFPDLILEGRGIGLISALDLHRPVAVAVQQHCQKAGVLVNAISESILRFLPPLTITVAEMELGLQALEDALREAAAGKTV